MINVKDVPHWLGITDPCIYAIFPRAFMDIVFCHKMFEWTGFGATLRLAFFMF